VPTVNGKTQPPGPSYKATGVSYTHEKSFVQFALDISKAYPAEAGVISLKRTIRLNRTKNVQVEDWINLKQADALTEHLMTCYPAEVAKAGELVIHYKPEGAAARDFVVRYDKDQVQPAIEKVVLDDPEDQGIISKWGDTIYRINFKSTHPKTVDKFRIEIALK
jgi:hypothetical protein